MTLKCEIVIESWNAYNNGYLFGTKWYDIADMTEEEFEELMSETRKSHEAQLNKALKCDDEICEEWFCPDWEITLNGETIKYDYGSIEPSPWSLFKFIQQYKEIENCDDNQTALILALQNNGYELDDAHRISEDGFLIEVGHNTDQSIGEYFVDEIGAIVIPVHIVSYFDYESYGRDISHDFSTIEVTINGTDYIFLYN